MNSDRSFDAGRALAALGGLVLLISLFLDWFGPPQDFGDPVSAWTAFELIDLILAAAAIYAIASALRDHLPTVRGAIHDGLSTPIAVAVLVLVAATLIDEPPAVREAELEFGAWLALAGAIAMLAGEILSRQRISVSVAPRDPAPGDASTPRERAGGAAVPPPPPAGPADETQTLPRN